MQAAKSSRERVGTKMQMSRRMRASAGPTVRSGMGKRVHASASRGGRARASGAHVVELWMEHRAHATAASIGCGVRLADVSGGRAVRTSRRQNVVTATHSHIGRPHHSRRYGRQRVQRSMRVQAAEHARRRVGCMSWSYGWSIARTQRRRLSVAANRRPMWTAERSRRRSIAHHLRVCRARMSQGPAGCDGRVADASLGAIAQACCHWVLIGGWGCAFARRRLLSAAADGKPMTR